MKYAPVIVGGLLGLLFVFGALAFFFHWGPQELPKEPAALSFMAAFGPTGYFTFIKILELVGGILVAIPRTRNLGLLVLGPIIVNIFAYLVFVMKGEGVTVAIVISLMAVYLLWVE